MEEISLEEAKNMCKENYKFFKENFSTLYDCYPEKYIAIKDEHVLGTYDDFDTAISATSKKEKLGTFIVQFCSKKSEDLENVFYSNNISFCVV
jgi:hypothetical protein